MKKRTKIIISAVTVFFLLLILSIFLGGNYLSEVALTPINPENSRDSVYFISKDEDVIDQTDAVEVFTENSRNEDYEWLKEASSVVSIKSFDNLTLNAYFAKPAGKKDNHKYLIMMHGHKSEPRKVSPHARHFYSKGYNVLVPGQRGHGWSDGNFIDMGYFAANDVKEWAEYLAEKDPEAEIVIMGVSMGAATVMMATGLDLPENVKCCVEDCGYTSVWEQFAYRMDVEYSLPAFPLLYAANTISKSKYDLDFKKISPKKAVANSKTPTLFIHGTTDTYVPFYMLEEVYEAASCEKEKLEIEGAEHARAAFKNPELYWNTVDAFTSKYIK